MDLEEIAEGLEGLQRYQRRLPPVPEEQLPDLHRLIEKSEEDLARFRALFIRPKT